MDIADTEKLKEANDYMKEITYIGPARQAHLASRAMLIIETLLRKELDKQSGRV